MLMDIVCGLGWVSTLGLLYYSAVLRHRLWLSRRDVEKLANLINSQTQQSTSRTMWD